MKAEIVSKSDEMPLAEVADLIPAGGDGEESKPPRKKPGRKPGSRNKTPAQKSIESPPEPAPDPSGEAIAQYAALYAILMSGASRAVSARFGEGVGWTPEEIAEAAPIFGRVAHKWLGESAYSDEIALAAAIIVPPALRFIAKKDSPEKMPAPPPYAPETRDN